LITRHENSDSDHINLDDEEKGNSFGTEQDIEEPSTNELIVKEEFKED